MIHVVRTVTIHQSLEQVFAYVSDVEHGPLYQSDLRSARKISGGPMGVGSTFLTWGTWLRGGRTNEVTAYEPNTRLAWKTTTGAPTSTSWAFSASGPSTRVTYTLAADLTGLQRLLEPLMQQRANARVDHDLAALKELLAVSRTSSGLGKSW
jgi:uncharacterized membrane protein